MTAATGPMLLVDEVFSQQEGLGKILDGENVFRYCEFSGFKFEGGHIDGAFLACTFSDLDWYWGLFNSCVFVDTVFINCVFRGTAFSGCLFVGCKFETCKFAKDNLNGNCSTADACSYENVFKDCTGVEGLFG